MDSETLITDDLLKQQEQRPLRKKRRLSCSDPENDEASSESGSDEHTPSHSSNSDSGFKFDWSLEPHSRVSNRTTARSPKLQAALPSKSYTFSSLGLSTPLQAALKSMSIKLPTEVQAACIPPLLEGKIKIRLLSEKPLPTNTSAKAETVLGMRKRAQGKRWRLHYLSSRNYL